MKATYRYAYPKAEVSESGVLYIVVMDPPITPHAVRFEDRRAVRADL
jgi:hypothetical protein